MSWAVLELRKLNKELADLKTVCADLSEKYEALLKTVEAITKKRHAKKD